MLPKDSTLLIKNIHSTLPLPATHPSGSVILAAAKKLDIYLPDEEGKSPYPVIVNLHGGAFMAGDNGHIEHLHSLFGLNADMSLAKAMQLIKRRISFLGEQK